jgi:glycosyltransferase involved in cell wall biosynthesis
MRIGMILDKSFPPDPRVENEARILLNDGHEVFLFCLDFEGITNEEKINGIQVRRYGSSSVEYRMSALAYTIPFYAFMLHGRINRFLRENKIQAIHVHDMVIAQAVLKANRSLQLPMVLDLHENRPEIMALYPHLQQFPGKYLISIKKWKRKEESLVRNFDRTVVVTEQSAADLIRRSGIEEQRVIVMPNTVSVDFFGKARIDKTVVERFRTDFVLLYLGDTGLRRGLLTAIEGLDVLRKSISEIRLVIVGANSTDHVLKKKVEELQLEDKVSFEGWMEESAFASYLTAADICISPLHRNRHHDSTLANKLFQYMAFSRPILASDAIAQKEIIERASCGLIHREQDAEDFAAKCLELYQDKGRRRMFGQNGQRFLVTEFSPEQVGSPLLDYYRSLERSQST